MKQEIENRINEIKDYVNKQIEQIKGIINLVENKGFIPFESQQITFVYNCNRAEWGLKEIERLEELKKRFE